MPHLDWEIGHGDEPGFYAGITLPSGTERVYEVANTEPGVWIAYYMDDYCIPVTHVGEFATERDAKLACEQHAS